MVQSVFDILSVLSDTTAMVANQYKSDVFFLTQKAAFDALDGSESGLMHISLSIQQEDTDALMEAAFDLKPKLIEAIKEAFNIRLEKVYPASFIIAEPTDDFTHTIKGYAFEDQVAWWATITETDQCIVITLVHYPQ